jgi:tetrahydromethanopterin S-methyltransferase subunit G
MSTLNTVSSRTVAKTQSPSFGKIASKVGRVVGRLLALLVTLLFCLPVIRQICCLHECLERVYGLSPLHGDRAHYSFYGT